MSDPSGQDFAARPGTPIPAAAPGEVVYSGFNDNFGNTVIVRNEAGYSLYAHMQEGSPMPKPGQRIWPGDIIGNVGSTGARSTGPHLHYSVIKNEGATRALQTHRTGRNLGVAVNGDTTVGRSPRSTPQDLTPVSLIWFRRPPPAPAVRSRLRLRCAGWGFQVATVSWPIAMEPGRPGRITRRQIQRR